MNIARYLINDKTFNYYSRYLQFDQNIVKVGWSYLNDCFLFPICIHALPEELACSCLFKAIEYNNKQINSYNSSSKLSFTNHNKWWNEFGVKDDRIDEIDKIISFEKNNNLSHFESTIVQNVRFVF